RGEQQGSGHPGLLLQHRRLQLRQGRRVRDVGRLGRRAADQQPRLLARGREGQALSRRGVAQGQHQRADDRQRPVQWVRGRVPDPTGMSAPTDFGSGGRDCARKYPPLLSVFVALLIALVVMPSALNLPQTNPTQTLEYAPVPPDNKEPPPPNGNLSTLGLGQSSSVNAPGALGGNNTPATLPPIGKGAAPSNKHCVGNPPRQTEDPVSPPCVAYFQGDNYGSTYQGVTKDEVRLLVYVDGNITDIEGSKGEEPRPQQEYFDLFQPPDPKGEQVRVTGLRAWQRYFNDRFQTYGRIVHFFVYFSGRDTSPESRR